MTSVRRPTPVMRRPVSPGTGSTPTAIITPDTAATPKMPTTRNQVIYGSPDTSPTVSVAAITASTSHVQRLQTSVANRVQLLTAAAAEIPHTGAVSGVLAAMTGALAAIQAVLLTLGLMSLIAVVAALGARGSSLTDLAGPVAIATELWLLGHGGVANIADLNINLTPIGMSLVFVVILRSCLRRTALKRRSFNPVSVISAIATYTSSTIFVANMVTQTFMQALSAGTGALVIALTATVLAFAQRGLAFLKTYPLWHHWLARVTRCAVASALMALLVTVGIGALAVVIWAVFGRDATVIAVTELAPGAVGGVILGVGQLAFLPNWILWATAWVAGPGFSVGQDTMFALGQVDAGPLPALPLFATLPALNWGEHLALWLPAAFLVVGGLAGWMLWRRLAGDLKELAIGMAMTVLTSASGMLLLQHMAAGSIGAGRLIGIGANPLLLAGIFGAEILVGCLVVISSQYVALRLVNSRSENQQQLLATEIGNV